jgi:NDP-sugar pyrophosphorylase family protein
MNNVKGIILAGGKGKRLAPLTLTVPKPLVIVNKKPLINYNLDLFSKYGVEEVKIIIRSEDREPYNQWYIKYA